MKKIIGLLLLTTCTVFAQREVQYQQYLISPMAINPAMAGSSETFKLNVAFRRQWRQNVPGLPLSQTFSMDGRVGGNANNSNSSQRFFGLGLQGVLDRTGPLNNTGIYGNMAYHYQLSDDQRISFGILAGVSVLPVFDIASGILQNKAKGTTGVGVNYQSEFFWVGVSMPEVWGAAVGNINGFATFTYPKPIFLHAGLYMQANDDIAIKPSVLVSQKGEYHFNVQATYQDRGSATLAYRSVKTIFERQGLIYGLLSYNINKNITAGYSYSSKMIENLGNEGGIHELAFTFTPNPKD
jgi:type IX secretion system PorP/SprF family membrane protein